MTQPTDRSGAGAGAGPRDTAGAGPGETAGNGRHRAVDQDDIATRLIPRVAGNGQRDVAKPSDATMVIPTDNGIPSNGLKFSNTPTSPAPAGIPISVSPAPGDNGPTVGDK